MGWTTLISSERVVEVEVEARVAGAGAGRAGAWAWVGGGGGSWSYCLVQKYLPNTFMQTMTCTGAKVSWTTLPITYSRGSITVSGSYCAGHRWSWSYCVGR